jgi:signal transduction histidine kinase
MELATVRRIVDAHDGDIPVRSTPGEGSLFQVRLPAIIGSRTAS